MSNISPETEKAVGKAVEVVLTVIVVVAMVAWAFYWFISIYG